MNHLYIIFWPTLYIKKFKYHAFFVLKIDLRKKQIKTSEYSYSLARNDNKNQSKTYTFQQMQLL